MATISELIRFGGGVAAAAFAALLQLSPAAAHPSLNLTPPDWATTPVDAHDLGGGVWMLESFGGNMGVVAGDGCLLVVDAEYPQLHAKVKDRLKAISAAPVCYLINTHWHWDHSGGDAAFAGEGALVLSSPQTRAHIAAAQAARMGPYQPDPAGLPRLTLGDRAVFHLGGQTVEVIKVGPAHTDGDLIVHYKDADVVQTGDIVMNGFYPDIDIAHGGGIDGMIAVSDQILRLCGPHTRVIPGHGDVATCNDVRAYRDMLRTVRARVAAGIAKGLSEDALIASRPLDDLDVKWGGNLVKQPYIVGVVYEDLSRRKSTGHASPRAAKPR